MSSSQEPRNADAQSQAGEVLLCNKIAMADDEEPLADNELANNNDDTKESPADNERTDSPEAENNANELSRVGGLEIIQETSGPINPTSFELSTGDEKKQPNAKNIPVQTNNPCGLEIIQQDVGPAAPMPFQHSENTNKSSLKEQTNHHEGLEIIEDADGPDPPVSFEQSITAKVNQNDQDRSSIFDCGDESISYPSRNDIEEGALQNVHRERYNEETMHAIGSATRNHTALRSLPIEEAVNLAEVERHVVDAQESLPNITEAYLVDDGSVVIAKPKVPWWKQRRTKVLLGLVLILIVTVLATSLKFALAPERTLAPSLQPSSAPSFSQMPSLAPSKCSEKVITNMRQIDLIRQIDLLLSDRSDMKIAIDGDNLVIAWIKSRSLYIAFYSRSSGSNDWVSTGYSIEPNIYVSRILDVDVDAVLSGNKALVGVASMNTVYAFVLSNTGLWVEVPFPPPSLIDPDLGFGKTVYICEDLVAVSDTSDLVVVSDDGSHNRGEPEIHFFKDSGGQWVEIGIIESGFDDNSMSELLAEHAMQDKYPTCLSTNSSSPYEASSTKGLSDSRVDIYQIDQNTTIPKHIQTLSSSVYGEGFGNWNYGKAMNEDLLVVGSAEHTHIFAREDGTDYWEEVLRLDLSYVSYELSGRTLIAVDGNSQVYSMIIADCTPEMSTQVIPSKNSENCSEMEVSISFELDPGWGFFDWGSHWGRWGLFITTSEFLEEDSILIQNYTGGVSHGITWKTKKLTDCLSQGWYRIVFQIEIDWYDTPKPACFNVHFGFPGSTDGGFEINGCVDKDQRRSSTSDEVQFDIPRTTLRMRTSTTQYPTQSPTISSLPSASLSPSQYPTTTFEQWDIHKLTGLIEVNGNQWISSKCDKQWVEITTEKGNFTWEEDYRFGNLIFLDNINGTRIQIDISSEQIIRCHSRNCSQSGLIQTIQVMGENDNDRC